MNNTRGSRFQPPKPSSLRLNQALSATPRASSFKYLRRALYLNQDNGDNLKRLGIKRIHIRKLIEVKQKEIQDNYQPKEMAQTHRKCFKKGLFKSLVNLELSSFYQKYLLEELKKSRKLVKVKCQPYGNCQAEMIIDYFERINKHIDKIDFLAENEFKTNLDQLEQIYKRIRKFSKLKAFHGKRRINEEEKSLFKEEFLFQSKYLQKLVSLQYLNCYLPEMGQVVLRDLMQEGRESKKVTKLEINLNSFLEWEPETTLKKKSDQIFPFFQFQVFPSLRELTLTAEGARFLVNYDSFVIKGFQKLSSLEKLDLQLVCYAPGIKFLFQGMLELPQLSACSLSFQAIKTENLETLTIFTKKQANIVSLKISFPSIHENIAFGKGENGSQLLEDFLANLGEKPKLKYLFLNAEWWLLDSLSRGLKRVVGTPSLRSFEVKATPIFYDTDRFYTSREYQDSVEGFCEFLLRTKETLCELALDIPLLQKQKVNQDISTAISQLDQLQNLWLRISLCPERDQNKIQLDPHLGLMLPHLKKLQELKLDFCDMEKYELTERKWMSESFQLLHLLKSLRRFEFSIPQDGLSKIEIDTIIDALEGLDRVVELDFLGGQPPERDCPHFAKILKTMKNVKVKRRLRMNLSF